MDLVGCLYACQGRFAILETAVFIMVETAATIVIGVRLIRISFIVVFITAHWGLILKVVLGWLGIV